MRVGGKTAHVLADFSEDDAGAEVTDARNALQLLDGGAKGRDMRVDLRPDRSHRFVKQVDLLEMKRQQETMMLGHATAQRLAQGLRRRLDAAVSECGQLGWVGLASDQGPDHRSPALPDNVGND